MWMRYSLQLQNTYGYHRREFQFPGSGKRCRDLGRVARDPAADRDRRVHAMMRASSGKRVSRNSPAPPLGQTMRRISRACRQGDRLAAVHKSESGSNATNPTHVAASAVTKRT
jgi:hypothetical protein